MCEPWLALLNSFYALELTGLDVLHGMTSRASHKMHDTDSQLYLAAQAHDEARHVYILDLHLGVVDGGRKLAAGSKP